MQETEGKKMRAQEREIPTATVSKNKNRRHLEDLVNLMQGCSEKKKNII